MRERAQLLLIQNGDNASLTTQLSQEPDPVQAQRICCTAQNTCTN